MSSPPSFLSTLSGGRLPIAGSPEGLLKRREYLVDRCAWIYNYVIDNGGSRYDANQVLEHSMEIQEMRMINLRLRITV